MTRDERRRKCDENLLLATFKGGIRDGKDEGNVGKISFYTHSRLLIVTYSDNVILRGFWGIFGDCLFEYGEGAFFNQLRSGEEGDYFMRFKHL